MNISGVTGIHPERSYSTIPHPPTGEVLSPPGKNEKHHDLYYVGPREKEQFQAYLNSRLRDKRLESLIKSLFRLGYGGNRNHTLMYTQGARNREQSCH